MTNNSFLIGIAGGTGSGKTSIANAIAAGFDPSEVSIIQQDSYYKDLSTLSIEERSSMNFDHPDAVDFDLMKDQLIDLLNGQSVNIPEYDYSTHSRTNRTRVMEKQNIIIIEGILALFDPDVRNLMEIKIYVETADDMRFIRRLERDVQKRGRTLTSVIQQYYKSVRPMHIQFVESTKKYADIIIPEGSHNKVGIDILQTKIMSLILGNQKTDVSP
tara:strand:+ start:299 stop:946 length:648 start_codon:yes stop_codon:yes gene_type:complete